MFGVWGLGFGVWGLVFGVWGLVFGVRCLVFGVWCLAFGEHLELWASGTSECVSVCVRESETECVRDSVCVRS